MLLVLLVLLVPLGGVLSFVRRQFVGQFSLVQLCVLEEPHRLVFEIPEQPELIHEMWIE